MPDAPVILDYAIQRATRVFCRPRPEVHLCAAAVLDCRSFSSDLTQEQREQAREAAREALHTACTEVAPRALDVVSRYANFERRAGNIEYARSLMRSLLDAAIEAGDPVAVEELADANISFEDSVRSAANSQVGNSNNEPAAGAGAEPMTGVETTSTSAALDANGVGNENANGSNAAAANEGKENSARNGEAGDGDAPPGDKAPARAADNPGASNGATATETNGTYSSFQSFLESALQSFPAQEGLWTKAVSEKEHLLPWGPERAQAVLDVYKRAIIATEPTEREVSSLPGADGGTAAATAGMAPTEVSTTPVLKLRVREKFAAAALTAMDFCGSPDQIWEAMELVLGLLGETLQSNAVTKRPAANQWQSAANAQPDANKQHAAAAPAGAAAVSHLSHVHAAHVHDPNAMAMYAHDPTAAAAAAAAAAAQQHQQYYSHAGYDYSMYYQQQAAAQGAAYPHGSDYTAYYQQYGYQTQPAQ